MKFIFGLIGLAVVISLILYGYTLAQAQTHIGNNIGIKLSNTCLTMIKNNITTNCPTYEELLLLYPDQSDPKVSGAFENLNGIYQRNNKQLESHFEFYRFDDKPRLWIDPPNDVISQMKIIFITSYDFIYPVTKGKMENATIEIGQSRYIDNCRIVTITSNNWFFLTGDSIQTLLLNCIEGSTNFNEVKIKKFELTNHDITTSAKWILEQRVKEIKLNCLDEFMKCKDGRQYKRTLSDSLTIKDRF